MYVVWHSKPRYWLHVLLFLGSIFTTLVVGAHMQFNFQHNLPAFTVGNEFIPLFPVGWVLAQPLRLLLGIPFSATLLLILLAHEMGHYVCCRYYNVDATLPFFIPAPTLIGTMGAVIRIRSAIRSRNALFDIGIAGPIAGFVVAVFTLLVALFLIEAGSFRSWRFRSGTWISFNFSAHSSPDGGPRSESRDCDASTQPNLYASHGDRRMGWE